MIVKSPTACVRWEEWGGGDRGGEEAYQCTLRVGREYERACVRVCVRVFVCVHVRVCACACVRACACVLVYTCMRACVYIEITREAHVTNQNSEMR